jgi:hypothetical protein
MYGNGHLKRITALFLIESGISIRNIIKSQAGACIEQNNIAGVFSYRINLQPEPTNGIFSKS